MARTTRRPGNLPAEATSFIGRRAELTELKRRLTAARLVSLVGPGGVGKTRLAIRAATDLGRGFANGAWLVELGELRDPSLAANAVLAALDLRDQSAAEPLAVLRAYLQGKQLLLVVDNCEHLLPAAARLVADVVEAAPGVRVIATSREPLGLAGEHVLPIPPLELPSPAAGEPLGRTGQNEAVMLFTERAAAASGSFELTPVNQAAVVDLCRRLDGLPLAIELAAVRTRVLSVEQIRDRLSDRFGLLTGGSRAALPRHQTLRTTIDWSHDLLSAEERILLRRLSVFGGRFTLEDVEGVCGPHDALDQLSSLVDKSLVIKEDARELACFRLHETMREYARLKLREAVEEDAVELRCIEHYRATSVAKALPSRYHLPEWLGWAELEIDNIRSVLSRCVARQDYARGLDIAVSVAWFWVTRATTEGVWWLDQLLPHGEGEPFSLAWGHDMRGFLAVLQSDVASAVPHLERAVAIAREVGEPSLYSQTLSMSAIAATMAGDRAGAEGLLDQSEQALGSLDDVPATLSILQARALKGLFEGDLDEVRTAAVEGARLGRQAGDVYSTGMMLLNQASMATVSGDRDLASSLCAEALRLARSIDDRIAQYATLDLMACHAADAGHALLAARLLGAADAVRLGTGASLIAFLGPLLDQAQEAALAGLGRSKFEAERRAGGEMPREAAVALALGERAEKVAVASGGDAAGSLGKRETEVARLVAEGLSNKQIGSRLFISERTVATHVQSILNKLGFNSRAQIAAWMTSGPR